MAVRLSDTATNASIAGAALLVLVVSLATSELVPAHGGLGYDGRRYARWVRELSVGDVLGLSERSRTRVELDAYSARRVLPALSLRHVMGALDVERSDDNVISGFRVLNVFLLVLAVWMWCQTALALGVAAPGRWMGSIGLLVSYANLKMPLFNPVLVDTCALALGSGMLLAWARDRWPLLVAMIWIGAFVWPTTPILGALLLAFPREAVRRAQPSPGRLPLVLAALAGLSGFVLTGAIVSSGYQLESTRVPPMRSLAWLSAMLTGGFLFLGLRLLLDSAPLWHALHPRRLVVRWRFWLALAVLLVAEMGVAAVATGPPRIGPLRLVTEIFYTSGVQPAVFVLAHVLYFGPLLLFLPFVWGRVARDVQRHGVGVTLAFVLVWVLAAGSESRKWIDFYPLVLLFVIRALENLLTPRRLAVLALLCILVSKVWIRMDQGYWIPLLGDVGWRRVYVTSRGPWIGPVWYVVQGVLVAGILAPLFHRWSRAARPEGSRPTQA